MKHELDNGIMLESVTTDKGTFFTGSPTGDHSIAPFWRNCDATEARIQAHWKGYVANAEAAYYAHVNR